MCYIHWTLKTLHDAVFYHLHSVMLAYLFRLQFPTIQRSEVCRIVVKAPFLQNLMASRTNTDLYLAE